MNDRIKMCIHGKECIKDANEFFNEKYLGCYAEETGMDCVFSLNCFTEMPKDIFTEDAHDVDEILAFLGGNPNDISDFDAEIDVFLDGEKVTVTEPAFFSIPAGMKHSLKYRSLNKPVIMWAFQMQHKN